MDSALFLIAGLMAGVLIGSQLNWYLTRDRNRATHRQLILEARRYQPGGPRIDVSPMSVYRMMDLIRMQDEAIRIMLDEPKFTEKENEHE